MCVLQKEFAEVSVWALVELVAVVFEKKNGSTYQLEEVFFPFVFLERKFWILIDCVFAVWNIGEKFSFLMKQLRIGLWSFRKIMKRSEAVLICSYNFSEYTIPITSPLVVQCFCSLVVKIQKKWEITYSFPSSFTCNSTQPKGNKEKYTAIKKGWFKFINVRVTSFVIEI